MTKLIGDFAEWLKNFAVQFFVWILCKGKQLSDGAAQAVADLLPSDQLVDLSTISDWLSYAEVWFPVGLAISSIGIYLGLAGIVWLVRMVIAFIPTIG